jgi:hypothetical protein
MRKTVFGKKVEEQNVKENKRRINMREQQMRNRIISDQQINRMRR